MSKTTMHLYCPPGIKLKLEILARANYRTMSSEVQALIEAAFKQLQESKPKE